MVQPAPADLFLGERLVRGIAAHALVRTRARLGARATVGWREQRPIFGAPTPVVVGNQQRTVVVGVAQHPADVKEFMPQSTLLRYVMVDARHSPFGAAHHLPFEYGASDRVRKHLFVPAASKRLEAGACGILDLSPLGTRFV